MMYSATDISIPCPMCGGRMYTGSSLFYDGRREATRYNCERCETWVEITPVTNATGNEVSYIGSFSETKGMA